jgi:hypothetical protein
VRSEGRETTTPCSDDCAFLHTTCATPTPLAHRSYFDQVEVLDTQRASRFNQQQVLDSLSPYLRQEVVLFTNAGLLSRLPSLARQPADVQAFVVEHLRRQVVSARDYALLVYCVEISRYPQVPRHSSESYRRSPESSPPDSSHPRSYRRRSRASTSRWRTPPRTPCSSSPRAACG